MAGSSNQHCGSAQQHEAVFGGQLRPVHPEICSHTPPRRGIIAIMPTRIRSPIAEDGNADPLALLRSDLDRLVDLMQTPEHAAGVDALFAADGAELGRILREVAAKQSKP